MNLDAKIRKIPDWPKPGVLFYDLTTLFEDKEAFRWAAEEIGRPYLGKKIDKVVGIEARGFLLAGVAAYFLGAGLVMARKKGKLPHRTVSRDYILEYASQTIEMHQDAIRPGERVLLVDDLVATGGTIKAAAELVEKLGGIVAGISWLVDLPFLGGSQKLKNYPCRYLIKYDSEKIPASAPPAGLKTDKKIKIGLIGGSGLEKMKILTDWKKEKISTPYGPPSDFPVQGKLRGQEAVVLARHGPEHAISPSQVNYRANIWALKKLGVTHILATTACGSLKEEIRPGDFLLPDQFIDRTTGREQTFYHGQVCHLPMAEPFCPELRRIILVAAAGLGITIHAQGTVVTIEGPRFSTKAESRLFRSWQADIVNMTTVPEAILAREAGICYQAMAMVTDYDCWHESEAAVDIGLILETMKSNAEKIEKLLVEAVELIDYKSCACQEAVKNALI